jgi:type IV pilus assembly protein PilE
MLSWRLRAGFTMVELTVVLAMLAMLASLAIPSYQGVVRKARRTEAQAILLGLALQQERWRADHPSYAHELAEMGAGRVDGQVSPYYRFEVVDVTATEFTVQAVAIVGRGQEHDRQGAAGCALLQIDQSRTRTPGACW